MYNKTTVYAKVWKVISSFSVWGYGLCVYKWLYLDIAVVCTTCVWVGVQVSGTLVQFIVSGVLVMAKNGENAHTLGRLFIYSAAWGPVLLSCQSYWMVVA